MVQANELRVGNWLKFYTEHVKIIAITGEYLSYWKGGDLDDEVFNSINQFKPIPLTPEILEKCGFERSIETTDGYIYCESKSENDFDVRFDGDNAFLQIDCCDTGREIKNLHQLQNLYFTLTGTELEINLT